MDGEGFGKFGKEGEGERGPRARKETEVYKRMCRRPKKDVQGRRNVQKAGEGCRRMEKAGEGCTRPKLNQ